MMCWDISLHTGIEIIKKTFPRWKKTGYVNIEFEQYVFQNISFMMDQYSSVVGKQFSDPNTGQSFKNWISDLTSQGTLMPNLSSQPEFLNQYNQFLGSSLMISTEMLRRTVPE